MKQTVVFIGAGNLATHLSLVLKSQGHDILQVYSRTEESAKSLADKLNADYVNSIERLRNDADLYFVALKDSVVDEVLSEFDFQNKLLVHCSGSLPLSILDKFSKNSGVLYPLQTFSKNRKIEFAKIPVFVESNSTKNEAILLALGKTISNDVRLLNSEKRKALHISAVLACNFVNHMYALAAQFLENKAIPFEVLQPLIEETAKKVQEMHPSVAQTGPAVRFDENIINHHLEQLNEFPVHQELYNSISKSIFELHQEKKK